MTTTAATATGTSEVDRSPSVRPHRRRRRRLAPVRPRRHRPARAQRCRQDDAAADAGDGARSRRRPAPAAGAGPGATPPSGTRSGAGSATCPSRPASTGGFTPFDLVDYVAVLKEHTDREWRRGETRRVLEAVGLGDVMHSKIRTLSGGMKQRVALAAAMIGSPDLLVLDEPATGLDPEQRLRCARCFTSRGTVVMSTHNISEVAALCQSVYVMFRRRVRFDRHPGRAGRPSPPAGSGRTTPGPARHPQLDHRPGRVRHLGDAAGRRAGRRPDPGRRLPPAARRGRPDDRRRSAWRQRRPLGRCAGGRWWPWRAVLAAVARRRGRDRRPICCSSGGGAGLAVVRGCATRRGRAARAGPRLGRCGAGLLATALPVVPALLVWLALLRSADTWRAPGWPVGPAVALAGRRRRGRRVGARALGGAGRRRRPAALGRRLDGRPGGAPASARAARLAERPLARDRRGRRRLLLGRGR